MSLNHCDQQEIFIHYISPLNHMSDQFKISPHNINTISSRHVMGIKKYISHGIIS